MDISEGIQGKNPIAKIIHDLLTEWWGLGKFLGKRVRGTLSKF